MKKFIILFLVFNSAVSIASSTPYQTATFQSGDYILGFDNRGGFQLGKVEQASPRLSEEMQQLHCEDGDISEGVHLHFNACAIFAGPDNTTMRRIKLLSKQQVLVKKFFSAS